jgi:NADH:ubiquinone oxidoreductase subunit 4 (subunit M)
VRAMYWQDAVNAEPIVVGRLTKGTMIVLTTLILVLGVYPQPVFKMLGGSHAAPTRVISAR